MLHERVWIICSFFCKQKTAYEMRISDWMSDVCSSDLLLRRLLHAGAESAGADFARFHRGVRDMRRDPRADRAVGGVRARRKDRRSAGHVSERRVDRKRGV